MTILKELMYTQEGAPTLPQTELQSVAGLGDFTTDELFDLIADSSAEIDGAGSQMYGLKEYMDHLTDVIDGAILLVQERNVSGNDGGAGEPGDETDWLTEFDGFAPDFVLEKLAGYFNDTWRLLYSETAETITPEDFDEKLWEFMGGYSMALGASSLKVDVLRPEATEFTKAEVGREFIAGEMQLYLYFEHDDEATGSYVEYNQFGLFGGPNKHASHTQAGLDEIFDEIWTYAATRWDYAAGDWDDTATSAEASILEECFDTPWAWDGLDDRRWRALALPLIGENVPHDTMIDRDSFKEDFDENCFNAFDEAGKSWQPFEDDVSEEFTWFWEAYMNDSAEATQDDFKLAKFNYWHAEWESVEFDYALLEELHGNGDDNDGVYTAEQFLDTFLEQDYRQWVAAHEESDPNWQAAPRN